MNWGAAAVPFAGLALALLGGARGAAAADVPRPGQRWVPQLGNLAPRGKGIWIRSLGHYGLDADSTAKLVADYGFQWVCMNVVWQMRDGKHKRPAKQSFPRFAEALAARGIACWIFGWAERGFEGDFLRELEYRMSSSPYVAGIICNAEKSYITSKARSQAATLAQGMRSLAGGRIGWGLTSYGGGPQSVPAFPWREWALPGCIGFPQIYDMRNNLGSAYPRRSYTRWAEAGFAPICPIWGASNMKTVNQMIEISNNTPSAQAVSWWDFYWVIQSARTRSPYRAQFVLDFPADSRFQYSR